MKASKDIPWKGIGVGVIFTIVLSVWAQYTTNIVQGSPIACDFSAVGAIFFLFVLAGLINPLCKTWKIPFTLSSRELITVYIMMITAQSVITMGLINQLPILASPFYYAERHKGYATGIQPQVNPLLVPQGKEVISAFFEGLDEGESIPWMAWVKPISLWMVFFLTLCFVMLCILVVVRKQWMERERISFPLVQVPLAMLEGESSSHQSPFFKNKLMWIGFAIPFIIGIITGLHDYFPFFPHVPLLKGIRAFRGTAWMGIGINFAVLGFLYLVNLDVSFSIWFFFLVSFALDGVFSVRGIGGAAENISQYGCEGKPIFAHLGIGALAAYVFYGLWTARQHLRAVFKKAFVGNKTLSDRDEILSYRTAVWGMIIGSIILLIWLNRLAGINIPVAIFFLVLAILIFFGLTKIVCQAGIPNAVATSIAPAETVSSLGASAIGSQGMVGIAQQFIWAADIRTNPMTHNAHALKLADESRQSSRWMFWVIMGAFVIAIISAFLMFLKLSYGTGGINLNNWYFGSGARSGANEPYWYVLDRMREATAAGPNALGWYMKILGAILMFLLSFMHLRFLWWPLNPIGLMLGPIWMMKTLWFSVFLAWLIKSSILRYGGPGTYRRLRPIFLGLILGQFTVVNLWLIVDAITGKVGHIIFSF